MYTIYIYYIIQIWLHYKIIQFSRASRCTGKHKTLNKEHKVEYDKAANLNKSTMLDFIIIQLYILYFD